MRTKFCLFGILLAARAYSQYMPVLDTGRTWIQNWNWIQQNYQYSCEYEVKTVGDTVIGGRSYKELRILDPQCNSGPAHSNFSGTYYYRFLREDTALKRIVVPDEQNPGKELILYNFAKNPGDTALLVNTTNTVVAVDTVTLGDGKPHRRLKLALTAVQEYFVIEGMGGTGSVVAPHFAFYFEAGHRVSCVSDNTSAGKITLYHQSGLSTTCERIVTNDEHGLPARPKLFPNPAVETLQVQTGLPHQSVVVSNILGQRVLRITGLNQRSTSLDVSGLPGGIYYLSVSDGTMSSEASFVK